MKAGPLRLFIVSDKCVRSKQCLSVFVITATNRFDEG